MSAIQSQGRLSGVRTSEFHSKHHKIRRPVKLTFTTRWMAQLLYLMSKQMELRASSRVTLDKSNRSGIPDPIHHRWLENTDSLDLQLV